MEVKLHLCNNYSYQPEGGRFPKTLARRKTISRGLTTWWLPHLKAITVLLYRSYSKTFESWMLYFLEDNKIISDIENTITESSWIFNTLPVFRGCRPGDNRFSTSALYMFGLFSLVSKFSVKHPNYLVIFIYYKNI